MVLNGIYNHLTWEDILDQEEGPSKNRGKITNNIYRISITHEKVWHWWKLIGLGGCKLPKRLCNILINNIDKLKNRENDEIFKQRIEPIDVACIYKYTMDKVLEEHKSNNYYFINDQDDMEFYQIIDYDKYYNFNILNENIEYNNRDLEWLFDFVDPYYYGNPSIGLSDPRDSCVHYHIKSKNIINEQSIIKKEILEIHDYDLFGRSFKSIINERYLWNNNNNENINIIYEIIDVNEVWKDVGNNYSDLEWSKNVILHHDLLCELTYQEIDETKYIGEDDYSKCLNYRNYFSSNNTWMAPQNPYYFTFDIENIIPDENIIHGENIIHDDNIYDDNIYDENIELNELNELKKKIKNNLNIFQEIIEDEIKEQIQEGIYLKIMNNLGDIYKIIS